MAAVTICSDFGALKNEVCHCFHYLSICHEVMGLDAMSEKVGLKLNIQKTKIMASGPSTCHQNSTNLFLSTFLL